MTKSGIPVLKIANIQEKRVLEDCKDHLPERLFEKKLEKYVLLKSDTLVAMTGAGSVGKFGKMPKIKGSFLVNQRVGIIRPNPELADPGYLYYVLIQDRYEEQLYSLGLGAGQPNVSAKQIGGLEIFLPDLPTQRKIAGILSAYDDLIENNLRRIKILEQMAQSLYREWFVHFRFPGHDSARFVGSELGQIPQGWNASTLGEFVENKSVHLQTGPFGTQLKASHYSHEGTPVINVRNIGFGTLRADKLEFLPPDKVDELKRHQLRSGDIVFGRKGAVERHLLVGPVEDGWIQGSDCIRLRIVSGPLTPRFLSIGFREADHQRWMMNQCSGGATMASLNQDILCRIPLAVPPLELLAKFDKFSSLAVDQVDLLASKIQTLRCTRDLLLIKLLSPDG